MKTHINRRQAIAVGATASLLPLIETAGHTAEPAVIDEMPIIDPHQHLWDLKKFRLPWHDGQKDSVLARDYLTADYLEATKTSNVVQAVYMEVDVVPEQHNAEADYVLELCKRPNAITTGAVISGRPGESAFGKYAERFADNPLIKGFRQVLHGDAPKGFCLEAQFVKNMQLLGDMKKCYDLCMRPTDLLDAVKLVDQCPKTRFVLDHCGNGPTNPADPAIFEQWKKGIVELSQRPNVVCKISGIVAGARENWQPNDLAPVINQSMDAFGEDRIMFAGDWPVCLLRASYEKWVQALKTIVRDRPVAFQRKLFHDNALKFYGLAARTVRP
jgi:L-fuconolactonase